MKLKVTQKKGYEIYNFIKQISIDQNDNHDTFKRNDLYIKVSLESKKEKVEFNCAINKFNIKYNEDSIKLADIDLSLREVMNLKVE